MKLEMLVSEKLGKAISESSNQEIYQALMAVVQDMAEQKESNAGKKKVYYVSAEFLIGKLLSNNMINLGIYEDVRKMLAANGKDICEIEEIEAEPSLGNGDYFSRNLRIICRKKQKIRGWIEVAG